MNAAREGRPPVGPQTSVRLTPEQVEWLDAMAAAGGRSRAELLRTIIDTYRQMADVLLTTEESS
jgi:predicted DNA-binding protein